MEKHTKEMTDFEQKVRSEYGKPLRRRSIDTLQVNLGLRCNQACEHCHLDAGPQRTEQMDWNTMEQVLAAAEEARCQTLDITGGSPELNPHFRRLISTAAGDGYELQVRTNLTVLLEPSYRDLPRFLAEHGVRVVASLPCYLEENVRAQRGDAVYENSIEALQRLNEQGYGRDADPELHLVYNPVGPSLPPEQEELEETYREKLRDRFGIEFTRLLALANMCLGRFRRTLREEGREQEYRELLRESFNPRTVPKLMCRRQINVGWNGRLYDCDFNQVVGWTVNHGAPSHISKFDPQQLVGCPIVTGEHCFGCTAGSGSSCGGALD